MALAKKTPLPKPRSRVSLAKPSPVRWKELEEAELELVQDMVELGSWWRVLDTSNTDDLTLSKILVGLKGKGVIEY